MLLLAGDIGGTKTDLAVYSAEGGPRKPLAQAEFYSGSHPRLEAIVTIAYHLVAGHSAVGSTNAERPRYRPCDERAPRGDAARSCNYQSVW
jgi:glucokinase